MAKKFDDDIISVIDDEEIEQKPKKRKKSAYAPPADNFKSEKSTGVKHYEAKDEKKVAKKEREEVHFYTDGEEKSRRPSLDGYEEREYEESALGNLYSDSGKTVCMVMRVISCLLFIIAPISFIGDMLALFGGNEVPASGTMISAIILSLISAIMFVVFGFLVIALIKILQNLMALQKKK